jgi:hypothetical protein
MTNSSSQLSFEGSDLTGGLLVRPILRRMTAPIELAKNWSDLSVAKFADYAEVFLVLWQSRTTDAYVSYDFLASTGDAFAHLDCDAFVVMAATVRTTARTFDAWAAATMVGAQRCAQMWVHDPAYARVWQKFEDDRKTGRNKPSLPMDVVTQADWVDLCKRLAETMPVLAAKMMKSGEEA